MNKSILFIELYPPNEMDSSRFTFEEQLKFIIGRENGDFLPRLMEYSQNLDRLYGANVNNKDLKLLKNGTVKQKVNIFNREYKNNCCRVCGYYVFSSGCEYCGTSREQHEFNLIKNTDLFVI